MIYYQLIKNPLTSADQAAYLPQTVANGVMSFDQFVSELAHGTAVMTADVRAVFDNLPYVIKNNLQKGLAVNMGFASIRSTVSGNFSQPDESFHHDRHSVEVTITPTVAFKKLIAQDANVERLRSTERKPFVFAIENLSTLDISAFRVHDLVKIRGEMLNFDRTDLSQGVFLTNENQTVRVTEYGEIRPRSILFKIPVIADLKQDMRLIVKAMISNELRTGELKQILTCE